MCVLQTRHSYVWIGAVAQVTNHTGSKQASSTYIIACILSFNDSAMTYAVLVACFWHVMQRLMYATRPDAITQEHEGTAENTFKPTPSSRKLLLPDGSQAIAASDRKEAHPFSRCDTKTRRLHLGSALDTLRPPPAPGLFERDWLRSLLCEG